MNKALNPPKLPLLRNRYFLIADLGLIPLAVWLSFLLRLDTTQLRPYYQTMLIFAVLAGSSSRWSSIAIRYVRLRRRVLLHS